MLDIIKEFLSNYNSYFKPIFLVSAWLLLLSLGWNIWVMVRDVVQRTKAMHEIPCSECRYFTNNYQLKCTVQPRIANTELAVNCPDFKPS